VEEQRAQSFAPYPYLLQDDATVQLIKQIHEENEEKALKADPTLATPLTVSAPDPNSYPSVIAVQRKWPRLRPLLSAQLSRFKREDKKYRRRLRDEYLSKLQKFIEREKALEKDPKVQEAISMRKRYFHEVFPEIEARRRFLEQGGVFFWRDIL
jgi:hypothetical protein